jgi:hypothetical protein
LTKIWEEMFSTQLFNVISAEQCPMLIIIMRQSAGEQRWLSKSEYDFTSLLKGDTLTDTQEKSTCETLLRELIIFKEKCDDNEQTLVNL